MKQTPPTAVSVSEIQAMASDPQVKRAAKDFLLHAARHKYTYAFSWLGRPIIQLPQDIVAVQELIWKTKPDLIVETGTAHGGGLVFYASMLELLGGDGHVVGIDIRPHNRAAIEAHPMFKRITMIEGSSTDQTVVAKVRELAAGKRRVMVVFASLHTHEHVLAELKLYSPLVTKGSYLVVFDTVIEDMPEDAFPDRPWGKGNNPKTAVWEFLKTTDRFVIDKDIQNKLLITFAPDGYLKCVKD